MSKKIISLFIALLSLLISLSSQECQPNKNNCEKCHPQTNLCAICKHTVYKPDENGGCVPTQQCVTGENYCNECNHKGDLCLQCELGFFKDENGGCSNTDNCVVSEKGRCFKCKDDFYLIEGYDLNFCKYKFSDDLKNCGVINFSTGKCISCKENFFMSGVDNKCTNTDSCRESTFGICTQCNTGFFLDKTDDLCKVAQNELECCKISLDGKICNECNEGFFLSEDNICTKSQNCAKVDNDLNCIECSEGYFLSKSGNICTTEEHCQIANYQFGVCEICEDKFYLDVDTRKCYSNQEDEKFKFCKQTSSGNCINCEDGYKFGKDNKCVSSLYCLESENGNCIKCEEGYHLGLDNRCVNIEKCIYSDIYGGCLECDNNYYYDSNAKQCFLGINQYKNCKKSDLYDNYCEKCKDDFYLLIPDKICYSNNEKNIFYKCAISTDNGDGCEYCIDNYYAGTKDLKCSKIEDCAISENENKCIECDEYMCLDVKKQICVDNYWPPENEEQKIYFNCIKTNEEGTKCEICDNNIELNNGTCVDKTQCAEENNGECVKCNEKSNKGYNMCLNSAYGCVETWASNCLRCDNILDFDECTECMEGYNLDDYGDCVDNEEF